MEVLANTRVVPATVRSEATTRLEELHQRYPKDGLVLFDFVMVKSGRWSGDDGNTSEEFTGLLKEALALDSTLAEAWVPTGFDVRQSQSSRSGSCRAQKGDRNRRPAGEISLPPRLCTSWRRAMLPVSRASLATYTKIHEKAGDDK